VVPAIRLSAFAIGVAVGAILHLRFGWKHLWSFIAALAVYVILDMIVETLLFGRVA
jgi:uncharacterized membrane protein YoaK (UPF0700 family)